MHLPQALYLALRRQLQLLGWLFRIDLPSMGHWRLGPGRTWGRGQGGARATQGPPPCQASSAASLLLPVEPSGGLMGLSPGLDSETDFWESTVAKSCNPDRPAGQCCSGPRPPQP